MHKLSIKAALEGGWSHFARRGWYLFGLTAAVIGLAAFASGNSTASALAYILFGGYIVMLLKHAKGESIVFDDLFIFDQRWIYFAFGSLIKGVLVLIGLALFIVPGVYLAVRWMFSELYILEDGMRPIEALKASSKLTEGYRLKLFWYVCLAALITLGSMILLFVGLFAAVAIVNLANIVLFWRLKEIKYLKMQEEQ